MRCWHKKLINCNHVSEILKYKPVQDRAVFISDVLHTYAICWESSCIMARIKHLCSTFYFCRICCIFIYVASTTNLSSSNIWFPPAPLQLFFLRYLVRLVFASLSWYRVLVLQMPIPLFCTITSAIQLSLQPCKSVLTCLHNLSSGSETCICSFKTSWFIGWVSRRFRYWIASLMMYNSPWAFFPLHKMAQKIFTIGARIAFA